MPLRIRVSLSLLLLLAWQAASAQPADEFFHRGAQSYLTNNLARAREEVDSGLKLFPDDIKLKKLDELLKQQSQQQSKDDQQKQDQEKKDQQQKQDSQKQKQQSQSNEDQKKQQSEKQSKDQKDQPKPDQKQSKSPGDKSKEKPDEKQPEEAAGLDSAHAMTPQEARQLLDAQKGDEKMLELKPQGKPENRERTIKDW